MEVQENISLRPYHTFGTDVKARRLARLANDADIAALASSMKKIPGQLLFLGSGSNVIFRGDFDGTVGMIATRGIVKLREDPTHVYVRAAAGESWDELVKFVVDKGWGGLENLSLIPGTVGAAPVQNIGAYGSEIRDTLFMVEALDRQSLICRALRNSDCAFGYRESIFRSEMKDRFVILSVTFRLALKPFPDTAHGQIRDELELAGIHQPSIQDIREAVIRIRRRKLPDPAVAGNAGSFFRNPVITKEIFAGLQSAHPDIPHFRDGDRIKIPAAWLIEQCGWKGYREGDAGVHRDQPLVLVNHGNASGKDILTLSGKISQSVLDRFGVELNPEVNIIGS